MSNGQVFNSAKGFSDDFNDLITGSHLSKKTLDTLKNIGRYFNWDLSYTKGAGGWASYDDYMSHNRYDSYVITSNQALELQKTLFPETSEGTNLGKLFELCVSPAPKEDQPTPFVPQHFKNYMGIVSAAMNKKQLTPSIFSSIIQRHSGTLTGSFSDFKKTTAKNAERFHVTTSNRKDFSVGCLMLTNLAGHPGLLPKSDRERPRYRQLAKALNLNYPLDKALYVVLNNLPTPDFTDFVDLPTDWFIAAVAEPVTEKEWSSMW